MAKHQCPRLFSGHLLDRVRHLVADAAQPFVGGIDERDRAAFRSSALGADDWEPLLPESEDDAERPFAANRNQGVQPIRTERIEQLLRPVALLPGAIRSLHTPFERIAAV